MVILSSRSATVLVIFIVAIIAFCFACVCASITGPISILPNESDSGGILDDLSAITNGTGDSGDSYGNQYANDYSQSSSSPSYSSSSDVETTVDSSQDSSSETPEPSNTQPSSPKPEPKTDSSDSQIETTVADFE